MPWKEQTAMSLRLEAVRLAAGGAANLTALSKRFGVSRKTLYKYLKRYGEEGEAGLVDQSRRPHSSPHRTSPEVERVVIGVRDAHQPWGGRKIRKFLERTGVADVPSASTVTAILRRNGRLDDAQSTRHSAYRRFEMERPNALWQMDFKGHFQVGAGRCHPLTVLDDCSRFAVCVRACSNERMVTVRAALADTFRRYGLPERILCDNGPPWGCPGTTGYTELQAWLMRLDVGMVHGRPLHPQTQGKGERFHGTLVAEVLRYESFLTMEWCQQRLDEWREVYNLKRPHEALDDATPASRYALSLREYPETLPPIEYGPGDLVRKVQGTGEICFKGREWQIGYAFAGQPVALRATDEDGILAVFYCRHRVATVDLRSPRK